MATPANTAATIRPPITTATNGQGDGAVVKKKVDGAPSIRTAPDGNKSGSGSSSSAPPNVAQLPSLKSSNQTGDAQNIPTSNASGPGKSPRPDSESNQTPARDSGYPVNRSSDSGSPRQPKPSSGGTSSSQSSPVKNAVDSTVAFEKISLKELHKDLRDVRGLISDINKRLLKILNELEGFSPSDNAIKDRINSLKSTVESALGSTEDLDNVTKQAELELASIRKDFPSLTNSASSNRSGSKKGGPGSSNASKVPKDASKKSKGTSTSVKNKLTNALKVGSESRQPLVESNSEKSEENVYYENKDE